MSITARRWRNGQMSASRWLSLSTPIIELGSTPRQRDAKTKRSGSCLSSKATMSGISRCYPRDMTAAGFTREKAVVRTDVSARMVRSRRFFSSDKASKLPRAPPSARRKVTPGSGPLPNNRRSAWQTGRSRRQGVASYNIPWIPMTAKTRGSIPISSIWTAAARGASR